jgi:hypothetical protein
MVCIDRSTPSYQHLGDLLRRTKTLYSYDHATLLFHEALISGCEILQVHRDGLVVDPRTCSREGRPCATFENDSWPAADLVKTYVAQWHDTTPAQVFAERVLTEFSR